MIEAYPIQILPQDGFITLMDIREMLKTYPSLVAVRMCDVPTEEAYVVWQEGGKKEFSDKVIKNCVGLSMNLLGGLFDKDKHSRFWPLAERARTDWNGGEVPPVTEDEYRIIEDERLLFFFYVRQWTDLCFPYSCGFSSKADYERAKIDAEKYIFENNLKLEQEVIGAFSGKNKPVDVCAIAEVKHHPTPMNYWHVQMDCHRIGQPAGKATKSELQRIGRMLKEILLKDIITEATVSYQIHPQYYMCIHS